jgi:hypothetical protein
MKGLGGFLLFVFYTLGVLGQPHEQLWSTLLRVPGQPVYIQHLNALNPDAIPEDSSFEPIRGVPIKSGKDLYLWVQGTGRLVRIYYDTATRTYPLQREDSTFFKGYNMDAFPFSYNGKIYNLGGYGFWKRNGHLRLFDTASHQWDVVKLNREVPVIINTTGNYLWLDADSGMIYMLGYREMNDGLKEQGKFMEKMMRLDIEKGEWVELGELSDYLKELPFVSKEVIALSSKGMLLHLSTQELLFLSFWENKIYSINTSSWDQFSFRKGPKRQYINFFIDSTLFSYNFQLSQLDSLVLKTDLLIDIHQPIYTVPSHYDQYLYTVFALVLFIPLLLFRKRLGNLLSSGPQAAPLPKDEGMNNSKLIRLEHQELQVLQLIYLNSVKKANTGIEEINTILGLSKRSTDIQKKLRSDCLHSINDKLGLRWGINDPVIDKKRTDFDKRSFEYYISPALLSKVADFLTTQMST